MILVSLFNVAASATPSDALQGESWTRVVVGLHDVPTEGVVPEELLALLDAHRGLLVRTDPRLGFAVVEVPSSEAIELVANAKELRGIKYAERDVEVHALVTPNDPQFPQQWALSAVRVPEAWNVTMGNHSQVVAVLDTGIQWDHPDLSSNICTLGPDYVNGGNVTGDDHGHGTFVSGPIAALTNNSVGVSGIAQACLMPIKVLNSFGTGWSSDASSGIAWAVDHGASIVSMSFGGPASTDEETATAYAYDQGAILVAAAGNDYCRPVLYPAAFPTVIGVGALEMPGDERASFSNCGPEVDISAPGSNVLTTSRGSMYASVSGTSIAAPHVAGIAALVRAARPSITNDEMRCLLETTSDDVSQIGKDRGTGAGRVNASRALDTLSCTRPMTPEHLQATPGPDRGQAALSWQPPPWPHNVTGYKVYRGIADEIPSLYETLGNVTAFNDSNLSDGQTYHYQVSAIHAGGESIRGVDVAVVAPHIPPAPRDLAATLVGASPGSTTLSWAPPQDMQNVPLTGYRIYRSNVSDALEPLTTTGTATSFTDATCPVWPACRYQVAAVNVVGEGARSNAANAYTPAGPIAVYPFDDSTSSILAISGTGAASCGGQLCVAASERGSASCWADGSPLSACIAATGEGNADCPYDDLCAATSLTGTSSGDTAVSGTGSSEGSVAASGTGESRGNAALSVTNTTRGSLLAISGTGNASCEWNLPCVAISPTGNADCRGTSPCFGISGTGEGNVSTDCNGDKCVDANPTGDAQGQVLAISGTGSSQGSIGVALFGDASGSALSASLLGNSTAEGGLAVAALGNASCDADVICVGAIAGGDAECVSACGLALAGGDATCLTPCAAIATSGAAQCKGTALCMAACGLCHAIVSIEGDAACADSCVAAALEGNATCSTPCAAIAPAGGAECQGQGPCLAVCDHCLAVVATQGDASCGGSCILAASTNGSADGGHATLALVGQASCSSTLGCLSLSLGNDAFCSSAGYLGVCLASSLSGNATCWDLLCFYLAPAGNGVGYCGSLIDILRGTSCEAVIDA